MTLSLQSSLYKLLFVSLMFIFCRCRMICVIIWLVWLRTMKRRSFLERFASLSDWYTTPVVCFSPFIRLPQNFSFNVHSPIIRCFFLHAIVARSLLIAPHNNRCVACCDDNSIQNCKTLTQFCMVLTPLRVRLIKLCMWELYLLFDNR